MSHKQSGFSTIVVLIIIVVLIAIGAVGVKVFNQVDSKDAPKQQSNTAWNYNEQKNLWEYTEGTPPACPNPLKFDYSPIDLSKIWVIGAGGTYRGYNYKVHGGFRLPFDRKDGNVNVVAPMDGTLVGLVRYNEGEPPDIQYKIDFVNDCGISYYFDHLYKLSPELEKIADKSPKPKASDTRTTFKPPALKVKAGDLIASQIGFPSTDNYGFDFGVVDYRQRNEISKNAAWAKIHNEFESSEWFGVCWLDMLPGKDAAKADKLSRVQANTQRVSRRISDYCKNYDYTTMDIEGGKPTEGN